MAAVHLIARVGLRQEGAAVRVDGEAVQQGAETRDHRDFLVRRGVVDEQVPVGHLRVDHDVLGGAREVRLGDEGLELREPERALRARGHADGARRDLALVPLLSGFPS